MTPFHIRAVSLAAMAVLMLSLGACQKTKKTASAGGGAGSQGLMTIRGAAR